MRPWFGWHDGLQLRHQLGPVTNAGCVECVAGVLGQFGVPGHSAKLGKLPIVAYRQNQVVAGARRSAFGGHDLKDLVRHDVLVGIASPA
jgi:hypothetical protein